jgi:hypothetical protein
LKKISPASDRRCVMGAIRRVMHEFRQAVINLFEHNYVVVIEQKIIMTIKIITVSSRFCINADFRILKKKFSHHTSTQLSECSH